MKMLWRFDRYSSEKKFTKYFIVDLINVPIVFDKNTHLNYIVFKTVLTNKFLVAEQNGNPIPNLNEISNTRKEVTVPISQPTMSW